MEQIQDIDIKRLELNKGQVEGLPKNPRFIRDERYKALVKSIEDAPEMLKLRELLVVEHGNKFVVIGGNMRLRACKELGMETVPCKVLPADTPVAKLREYAIKDNNGFGEDDWDVLANEWDAEQLDDWGVDVWQPQQLDNTSSNDDVFNLPEELDGVDINPDDLPKIEGDDETAMERIIIVYPKEREEELAKLVGLEKIDKVVYDIDELNVIKAES